MGFLRILLIIAVIAFCNDKVFGHEAEPAEQTPIRHDPSENQTIPNRSQVKNKHIYSRKNSMTTVSTKMNYSPVTVETTESNLPTTASSTLDDNKKWIPKTSGRKRPTERKFDRLLESYNNPTTYKIRSTRRPPFRPQKAKYSSTTETVTEYTTENVLPKNADLKTTEHETNGTKQMKIEDESILKQMKIDDVSTLISKQTRVEDKSMSNLNQTKIEDKSTSKLRQSFSKKRNGLRNFRKPTITTTEFAVTENDKVASKLNVESGSSTDETNNKVIEEPQVTSSEKAVTNADTEATNTEQNIPPTGTRKIKQVRPENPNLFSNTH